MVNRALYDDFTVCGTERRTCHGNRVEYTLFACPYANCGKRVAVPTADVSRWKSTRCLAHLVDACQDPAADHDRRPRLQSMSLGSLQSQHW